MALKAKQSTKPTFTVQERIVLLVEVTVQADSLEQALEIAKGFERSEIADACDGCSIVDDSITTVGAYSDKAWTVEQ
jgi:hypothetical protein